MLDVQSHPSGIKVVAPVRHGDARGFFSETYSQQAFGEAGIVARFVQDNHSLSVKKGVVRGLHFQAPPFEQAKLVRVPRGRILDVAVDLRRGSPDFGKPFTVELSASNWRQIFVPRGFAHGFCTLEPDTEVLYKVDNPYSGPHEAGLAWDDPQLGIAWPVRPEDAELSERDRRWPGIAALDSPFAI